MPNFLKKLVKDWRDVAESPTLASHGRVKSAYYQCAQELDAMIGAVEALGKFIKGNGAGLPHGTIAWVIHDEKRYIREWHPMPPDINGKPLGNWWGLEGGESTRFSEYEVTHYSIIEVPPMPGECSGKKQCVSTEAAEFQAVVGKSIRTGKFHAFTILANVSAPSPMVVDVEEDTEAEALRQLKIRCDAVLKTFFHSYRTVRI